MIDWRYIALFPFHLNAIHSRTQPTNPSVQVQDGRNKSTISAHPPRPTIQTRRKAAVHHPNRCQVGYKNSLTVATQSPTSGELTLSPRAGSTDPSEHQRSMLYSLAHHSIHTHTTSSSAHIINGRAHLPLA